MAALLTLHQNQGKISLELWLGASCSIPSSTRCEKTPWGWQDLVQWCITASSNTRTLVKPGAQDGQGEGDEAVQEQAAKLL